MLKLNKIDYILQYITFLILYLTIMNTKNPIRKAKKKLRHLREQFNKYRENDPELAKKYFWKIDILVKELNILKTPPAIIVYQQNKSKGIVTKKPKFKKKRVDKSVEFQKRRLERERPSIIKNKIHKMLRKHYDEQVKIAVERNIDRRYDVMMKLAKTI